MIQAESQGHRSDARLRLPTCAIGSRNSEGINPLLGAIHPCGSGDEQEYNWKLEDIECNMTYEGINNIKSLHYQREYSIETYHFFFERGIAMDKGWSPCIDICEHRSHSSHSHTVHNSHPNQHGKNWVDLLKYGWYMYSSREYWRKKIGPFQERCKHECLRIRLTLL